MPSVTPNFGFYLPLVNNATDQDLWGGYLNDNWSSLDTLLLAVVPPGVVAPYAGTAAPTGYLLCYGQLISRVTYAALFGAIGTTFGVGDGLTTFGLPDLRGRAPFGKDNMGGSAANRITNAISGITGTTLGAAGGSQSMQSHTHTAAVTDPGHDHVIKTDANTGSGGVGNIVTAANSGASGATYASNSSATGITVSNTATGAGASQNMPPAIILNYIIKT